MSVPEIHTPWGKAQRVRNIAPGIDWVSTASHGGYVLAQWRYDLMARYLRECSFTKDRFFEEDCAWCAVVLAFPEEFTWYQVDEAQVFYNAYYERRNK